MSKKGEHELKRILTKNNGFDHYFLLFSSVVAIVLAILIFFGLLQVNNDKKEIIADILLVLGVLSFIMSIVKIIDKAKMKKSVFYAILKNYDADSIKNAIDPDGINNLDIEVELDKISLIASIKHNDQEFILLVREDEVSFVFDYKDDYYESLDDEKKNYVENIDETFSPFIMDSKTVFKRFLEFYNKHKENI